MLSFLLPELLPSHLLATRPGQDKALIPTDVGYESVMKQNMSTSRKKKQNMFTSENNLESMRVHWIYKETEVWNPLENKETKSLNFIYWIIVKKKVYKLSGLFKSTVKLEK